MEYPENLAEGAFPNQSFSRSEYLQGLAQSKLGQTEAAEELWRKVAGTPGRPLSEGVVYQALSLRQLGKAQEAERKLRQLVDDCQKALTTRVDPVRLFVLSQAYKELGMDSQANKALLKATEADADVVLMARLEAAGGRRGPMEE